MDSGRVGLNIVKKFKEHVKKKKLHVARDLLEKNYRHSLIANMRNPNPSSKMLDGFEVVVEDLSVVIKADWQGFNWFEYGTNPHVIEPKNKSSLRFRSTKNSNYGEYVFTTKVNHPGTQATYAAQQAVFLTSRQLKQLFK